MIFYGLLPCAGNAERMQGIPKYLLPTKDSFLLKRHEDMLYKAGAKHVVIPTKKDDEYRIREYANHEDTRTCYAFNRDTMAQSVLSARSYISPYHKERGILFGLPDTFIEDEQCYVKLANAVSIYPNADVILAVAIARPEQHKEGGMCWIDNAGKVLAIEDKSDLPNALMPYIWCAIVWKPLFWSYIQAGDSHVGFSVERAINEGIEVRSVVLEGGFWDCGTPQRYFDLINYLTCENK